MCACPFYAVTATVKTASFESTQDCYAVNNNKKKKNFAFVLIIYFFSNYFSLCASASVCVPTKMNRCILKVYNVIARIYVYELTSGTKDYFIFLYYVIRQ